MTLRDIRDRIAAATGTDRDIDADIYEALGYEVKRRPERVTDGWRQRTSIAWRYKEDGRWLAMGHLTWSIDDAVRIVERRYPDWLIAMGSHNPDNTPWACITEMVGNCRDFSGSGATIPLAICDALLTLISEAEKAESSS